jgi:hypothetical protein
MTRKKIPPQIKDEMKLDGSRGCRPYTVGLLVMFLVYFVLVRDSVRPACCFAMENIIPDLGTSHNPCKRL